MINIFAAYDDKDPKLGTYFEDCKKQLLSVLGKQNDPVEFNVHEIPGDYCNNAYIDSLLIQYLPHPFIFIAYSHGSEWALHCEESRYVEKGVNTDLFRNSLLYTTACSAGKELGNDLINQGCSVFIGYKREINVFSEEAKRKISMLCDNAGIIEFLTNDITIFEAFKKMEDFYTEQIDSLNDAGDMLFAMELVDTRESLVFLGKPDLRKEEFFLQ